MMPAKQCPSCHYELPAEQPPTCPNCGRALAPLVPSMTEIDVSVDAGAVTEGGQVTGLSIGKIVGDVFLETRDPDEKRIQRARAFLLERVKSSWIEGVLERLEAVYTGLAPGGHLIDLDKQLLPDAVDSSNEAVGQVAYLQPENRKLPPGQALLSIFDQQGKSLLILAEPGAGKTTALLELCRDAIARAGQDATQQIPVVLDLSSWSNNPINIAEWIVFELNTTKYGIPKEIGRKWVRDNDLLLLLDGLDQIGHHQRDDCMRAINQFQSDHGPSGIVVTCRCEEYGNIGLRLKLRSAILLEALRRDQIAAYFQAAGAPLAGLYRALEADAELQKLVESPLILTIMSLTYRDVSAVDFAPGRALSPFERRRQLFDAYIQRMFKYKGEGRKPFADVQTIKWLSWLARRLDAHNQTTFWIEQMQPSWLPSARWQWLYMVISRLWVAIIGGLIGGIVIGVAGALPYGLGIGLLRGLIEGFIGGLIAGPVIGLVDMAWITYISKNRLVSRLSLFQQSGIKMLLIGLIVGLSVAFVFWLFFGTTQWLGWGPEDWIFEGLSVGLVFGLSAGLLFGFGPQGVRHSLTNDIQTVEHLSWSPGAGLRWAFFGAIAGVFAGGLGAIVGHRTALIMPMIERGMSMLSIVLATMALGVVFLGLVGFVFGGLSGTFVKIEKATPNQGLRLSVVNAVTTAALVGVIFGILGFAAGRILGQLQDAITFALYGVFIGVLAALWYGGLFVIQHGTLRILLWFKGLTPRPGKFASFFDYAAQRIFLRKIGGGYLFIHSYLQEHFAGLDRDQE